MKAGEGVGWTPQLSGLTRKRSRQSGTARQAVEERKEGAKPSPQRKVSAKDDDLGAGEQAPAKKRRAVVTSNEVELGATRKANPKAAPRQKGVRQKNGPGNQKTSVVGKVKTTRGDRAVPAMPKGVQQMDLSKTAADAERAKRRRLQEAVERAKRLLACSRANKPESRPGHASTSPPQPGVARTSDLKRPSVRRPLPPASTRHGAAPQVSVSAASGMSESTPAGAGKEMQESSGSPGVRALPGGGQTQAAAVARRGLVKAPNKEYPFRRGTQWRDMDCNIGMGEGSGPVVEARGSVRDDRTAEDTRGQAPHSIGLACETTEGAEALQKDEGCKGSIGQEEQRVVGEHEKVAPIGAQHLHSYAEASRLQHAPAQAVGEEAWEARVGGNKLRLCEGEPGVERQETLDGQSLHSRSEGNQGLVGAGLGREEDRGLTQPLQLGHRRQLQEREAAPCVRHAEDILPEDGAKEGSKKRGQPWEGRSADCGNANQKKKPRKGGMADDGKLVPAFGSSGTPDKSIFIGDLNPATTHRDLAEAFGRFGTVTHARMVEWQCYGFVTFSKREEVEAAVAAAEGGEATTIKGLKARVSWARGLLPEWQKGIGGFRIQTQGDERGHSAKEKIRAAAAAAAATADALLATGQGDLHPLKAPLAARGRQVVAYDDLF